MCDRQIQDQLDAQNPSFHFRYSREMDDIETITSSYKSRMTNSNEEKGSIDELINTDSQCAKGSRGVDSGEIEILTELE